MYILVLSEGGDPSDLTSYQETPPLKVLVLQHQHTRHQASKLPTCDPLKDTSNNIQAIVICASSQQKWKSLIYLFAVKPLNIIWPSLKKSCGLNMKCPPKAHVRTPELQLVVLPSWEDCGTFRRYSLGWKESPGKVPEVLQSSLVPCFLSASLVCMWCDQPASRFSLQMVPFLWFSAVMMASLGILRQKKNTFTFRLY